MKNLRLLLTLSILSLGACFPNRLTAQESLCLDSCLQWAVDNYPLVEQLQLIDRSRDYNLKNINTGYILHANITAFGGYIEGIPDLSGMGMEVDPWRFAGILQVEQPIWDGGQLENRKKIARAEAEVNKSTVEIKIAELKDKVSEIYFGILLAQTQREQLQLQQETLEQSLKTLQSAAKAGSAFTSDADAVEVKLLQIEQQGVQLRSSERAYRRMLAIFIGRPVGETTVLAVPDVVLHHGQDLDNRPEMALFEHRKQLLDAYNPGAGEVLPRVSLQGMGLLTVPKLEMQGGTDWNHLLMGGINVSWPIGGRTYTMGVDKKRLKVEKDQVDREKESFEMGQRLNLTRQAEMLAQWDDLIAYDDRIIDLLARRTRTMESRYKNGVVPVTEWLQAVSEEGAARQAKAMHGIQKMMTSHQYNRELGY
ncbi:MAG: TolC family protein [Bacteroidales bacterium]|nr:TolC family protein [Bacteroidales bacterium]